MKLFEELTIKFERPDWSRNPEFGLIDTILEKHPDILLLMKEDIAGNSKDSPFVRGDVPSVEQIVRAAIYKEMKGMDYRELESAQILSSLPIESPIVFRCFRIIFPG